MDERSREAEQDPTGRRSLLKKAAVGTAAAWIAPAVLSSTAGAQGSPSGPSLTPATVDVLRCDNLPSQPSTIGTGGGGDPLIPYPTGTTTGDLILVSASANDTGAMGFAVATNAGTPVPFTQALNIQNTGGIATSLHWLIVPALNAGTGITVQFSGGTTPVPVTVAVLRVTGSTGLGGSTSQAQSTVAQSASFSPALAVGFGSLAISIVATPLGAAPFTPKAGWADNGNASLNGAASGCGNNRPDLAFMSRFEGTDSASATWASGAQPWTQYTVEALP